MFGTLIIVTLIFIIWCEISVGNVALRTNATGGKSLNLESLSNLMTHPFRSTFLWHKDALDINYAFVIGCTMVLYWVFHTSSLKFKDENNSLSEV